MPQLPEQDRTIAGLQVDQRTTFFDTRIVGLSLRVSSSTSRKGRKTWTLMYYNRNHRRLRHTLGTYPALTLADARQKAMGLLLSVQRDGADPQTDRQEDRDRGIAQLVDAYIERYAKRHKDSWTEDARMLNTFVVPAWGRRPPGDITRADVRALIETIAGNTPTQANRVYEVIRKMFYWAKDVEGFGVRENPAARMRKPADEEPRERVLTDDEVRAFWTATEALQTPLRAFWRLRLLTCQRASEVAGMRWTDLHLAEAADPGGPGAHWVIPARQLGRKNRRAQVVPLTAPVLELLQECQREQTAAHADRPLAKVPVYVLAGARGKRQRAASAATFEVENFCGHDLRRTATTAMRKHRISRTDVTYVLGQTQREGSVALAHYDMWDGYPEKQRALTLWARVLQRTLTGKAPAKVVALGSRRRGQEEV